MFSWLVSLRYRMFQTLLLDFNHNRRMIGTRVVWNNPSAYHVHFRFLKENWKYQMPVWTGDLDQAIAEVIRTDYDWPNVYYFCPLFHTERSWQAYWCSAVYFWSTWFSLWCESRPFFLASWNVNIFICS